MKLDWSKIGEGLKESTKAIWKGEFILRLRADKFFLHILYAFLLAGITIYIGLMVDKTLTKVEKNKDVIRELEVEHAQKTGELVRLQNISTTLESLRKLDSEVGMPEKPATIVKTK
jgi:hypothetical protein